jgi:peptide deformylase
MAQRRILRYPHPLLREQCQAALGAGQAWDADVRRLIHDLVETMYAHPGTVGLAAPQVGETVRIFVMDVAAKTTRDQLKILVNPEIIQQSRNKTMREGCLSFPEYLANVKRATRLRVRAWNLDAQPLEWEADGLEAVAIQHELDHLNGVLFIDRISALKTDLIRRGALPELAAPPAAAEPELSPPLLPPA